VENKSSWQSSFIAYHTANSATDGAWIRLDKFYNPTEFTAEVVYESHVTLPDGTGQILVGNPETGGMAVEFSKVAGAPQVVQFQDYVTINGSGAYRSVKNSYEILKIQSMAAVHADYGSKGCGMGVYISGAGVTNSIASTACTRKSPNNNTVWAIGANPNGRVATGTHIYAGRVYAIRIYDRALTEEEIMKNSDADQLRFLAPPVVKVGDNTCTNVVVLSTTKLQCTVPQVASASTQDITVYDSTDTNFQNPKTLQQAYTYVNESAMSITTIDPKAGPSFGGSKIRLTGKNLNVSKVTIAGRDCTNGVQNDQNTTYTCEVPSIDITEDAFVDVIVTPTQGNNYVFAQAFQYVKAKKNPVEFNVE
jgi:hypothetical protein